jgi:hypothetical protein
MAAISFLNTIMGLLFLGSASAALLRGSVKGGWEDAPWYCHGLDCPSFTNSTVDGMLEVRSYDAFYWASTDIETFSITEASNIGFQRLFDYISGANEGNVEISMTSPVLNQVQPGAGPNCNSTFTVSFFVPYMYQEDPNTIPKPTNPEVYIKHYEPLHVAIAVYDGYAVGPKIIEEAAGLESAVEESSDVGIDINYKGGWFFAGYDSPYHLNNRHNENWQPVVDK